MLTPEQKQQIEDEERYRAEVRATLPTTPLIVQSKPSNGAAAVLSLFIPGAGQMYKGDIGRGIAWLIFTVIGYVCLIVPGLILHLICVGDAFSYDPSNPPAPQPKNEPRAWVSALTRSRHPKSQDWRNNYGPEENK
jgi:TM2 domain-containing membrane protein YozV